MKLRRKHKFLTFKVEHFDPLFTELLAHIFLLQIGDFEIDVDAVGAKGASYADFKASLSPTDCRYAVYDQEFTTADGRPSSKVESRCMLSSSFFTPCVCACVIGGISLWLTGASWLTAGGDVIW